MFKQVPAKAAVVKDEPVSPPAIKQESQAAANKKQSGKDSKGGADEKKKRVIVKKEYDMPGQTKDTPLAVGAQVDYFAPTNCSNVAGNSATIKFQCQLLVGNCVH